MKKLVSRILIIVAISLLWSAAAFASGIDISTPPDAFEALVVEVFDFGVTPLEYDFMFKDGEATLCFYGFDIATSGGGTVRVDREYMLTYCKTTCISGEPVFITGSYSETSTGAAEGFMAGHVEGQLVTFDSDAPDSSLIGSTYIALTHYPDTMDGVQSPEQLVYTVLFLEPVGWFPAPNQSSEPFTSPTPVPSSSAAASASPSSSAAPRAATPTPNSGFGLFASPTSSDDNHTDDPYETFEEDHHHSGRSSSSSRSARKTSSSDLPETSGAAQVAVGAILVSVAAVLSNIPSATLGSGMSSFAHVAEGTSSGGTSSAQGAQSASEGAKSAAKGAEGASEGAAGEYESVESVPQSAAQAPSAVETASGAAQSAGSAMAGESAQTASAFVDLIKNAADAVWDFIKMLIANLRDMLADEGRSYASGKLSDLFDDEE